MGEFSHPNTKAPKKLIEAARKKEYLPLEWGWDLAVCLTVTGEIVVTDLEETELALNDVRKEQLLHAGLVTGSEKYPVLLKYLPIRPSDGVTCPSCNGEGKLPAPMENFGCSCGGIGWYTRCVYEEYESMSFFNENGT
jgi:hypothetical protein